MFLSYPNLCSVSASKINFHLSDILLQLCCRGMKARLASTYPDAFPDGAMSKTMDQRPDLESPLD
jgi:hypothetical protein